MRDRPARLRALLRQESSARKPHERLRGASIAAQSGTLAADALVGDSWMRTCGCWPTNAALRRTRCAPTGANCTDSRRGSRNRHGDGEVSSVAGPDRAHTHPLLPGHALRSRIVEGFGGAGAGRHSKLVQVAGAQPDTSSKTRPRSSPRRGCPSICRACPPSSK